MRLMSINKMDIIGKARSLEVRGRKVPIIDLDAVPGSRAFR
jgi:hypothetical protein